MKQAFMLASNDRNPLHWDSIYATRTQFGRPIVYGVCTVLTALAKWSLGRQFSIKNLHVKFEKHLCYNEPYLIEWVEQGTTVKIHILKGKSVATRISFEYKNYVRECITPAQPPNVVFATLDESLVPALDDGNLQLWSDKMLPFSTRSSLVNNLQISVGLQEFQMPMSQLVFLLWASYFVGMQVPGRQALFSELTVEFNDFAKEIFEIDVKMATVRFDPRFNRMLAKGTISSAAMFQIVSFVRPVPSNAEIADILKHKLDKTLFRDKVFLISGSSRGFGEALAKVVALQGGRVAINFRKSSADGKRVMSDLQGHGCKVEIYGGDVGDSEVSGAMLEKVSAELGKVDYCICNASPLIEARRFSGMGSDGLLSFVAISLRSTLGLLAAFLDNSSPEGMAVLISSTYVSDGKSEFSHYVTAKAAQEKMFQSLAKEYRDRRFLVVRLPKMLTDQTNVPFDREPAARAVDVAKCLSSAIASYPLNTNFVLMDNLA